MLTPLKLFDGPFGRGGVTESVSMQDKRVLWTFSIPGSFFLTTRQELISHFWGDYFTAEWRFLKRFHKAWASGEKF